MRDQYEPDLGDDTVAVASHRGEERAMDLVQSWLVIGVPGLVVVTALFVGRSQVRALVGYVVLLAVIGHFATTPGGAGSAAVVGMLAALLVATGRGTRADAGQAEHHQQRRRYTTADPH